MGGQVRQIIDRFEFQPQRKAADPAVREFPTAAAASVRELIDQFNGLLGDRDGLLDWVGRRPMQFRRCHTSESTGREENPQVCAVEATGQDDALKVDEVRPVERVEPEEEKQVEISLELLDETETNVASVVENMIVTVAEESTESDASTVDGVSEGQLAPEEPPVAASEEPGTPITETPETHVDQLVQDPSAVSASTTEHDTVEERPAPIVVDSDVPAKDKLAKQEDEALVEPEPEKSKSPLSTGRPSKPVPSTGSSDKVTSRYLAYQATSRYARIQEANIQRRKMNELKRSEQVQQTVRSASRSMGPQGTRAAKSVPAARRQTLECSKLSRAPKAAPAKRLQSAPVSRHLSQEKKPVVVCREAPDAPTGRPRRASAPNFSAAGLSVPKAPASTGSIKRAPVQRSSSTESHKAKLKNVQSRLFAFETDPQHLQKVEANRSRVVSLKMRSERVAR